jgi:hypothetical protein
VTPAVAAFAFVRPHSTGDSRGALLLHEQFDTVAGDGRQRNIAKVIGYPTQPNRFDRSTFVRLLR